MAKKSALTKDEKRLLYYVSASVIITLAVVLWLQSLAIDPVVTIPSPKRPNPNAYDYYLKATKFFVSCPVQTSHGADTFDYNDLDGIDFYHGFVHGKNRQLWKPTLAQLLKLQQLNMPAFATLRQGFKYQYSSVKLSDIDDNAIDSYENAPKLYMLSRKLAFDAYIRRKSGDWNGAVNDAIDAIYLGEDLARGAALGAEECGRRMESIGRCHVWPAIDHLNATEARMDARRMEEIIRRHVPLSQVLQEQKRETQAYLLRIFKGALWQKKLLANADESDPAPDVPLLVKLQSYTTSKRQMFADYTRYLDALIIHAGKRFATAGAVPQLHDQCIDWFTSTHGAATWITYEKGRVSATACETQNSLLLVSLALRAYRLEHGSYPRTLDKLAPSYLHVIPLDPFGFGEALHYKCSGTSYVLYSIGPDGKDDGGKPSADAQLSGPGNCGSSSIDPDTKWDIVAGVNVF